MYHHSLLARCHGCTRQDVKFFCIGDHTRFTGCEATEHLGLLQLLFNNFEVHAPELCGRALQGSDIIPLFLLQVRAPQAFVGSFFVVAGLCGNP
jgi:hypothetical protein